MPGSFDLERARAHLREFEFQRLFVEELHWNAPRSTTRPIELRVGEITYSAKAIAGQASIPVYEIVVGEAVLQSVEARAGIAKELRARAFEALIVFRDEEKRSCVWNWLKREGKKTAPREHTYFCFQPGDLFLQKTSRLFVDLAELDEEGNTNFRDILGKIEAALDTQPVTKKFYKAFQDQYTALLGSITGIRGEKDRRWFTSLLLNRLMFVAFLEAKGFLEDDRGFLRKHLDTSLAQGKDNYYRDFLQPLFFEAFATPNSKARSARARKYFARIRYLNGGLFVKHRLERDYETTLRVPDSALDEVLQFFGAWTWTLDDTVGGRDDTINPDVLGHIFERYNNARQKEDGAYYTKSDITTYLAERTIPRALLARLGGDYIDLADLYARCDAKTAWSLLRDILPTFRVIDSACGSGAFILAAFRMLQEVYAFLLDLARRQPRGSLREWADELIRRHQSPQAAINETIVTQNLYGVELNQEAVEVARLRMFLELVAPIEDVAHLQPLPNLEYNIMQGNSLIGFREQPDTYETLRRQQPLIGRIDYRSIIEGKDESLIAHYKTESHRRLKKHATKDRIERARGKATRQLDALLVREFDRLKIRVEEQRWDSLKKKSVIATKRPVTLADLEALSPFHWDYEFRDVFASGGFDVVITNPPWETLKPQAKEFFSEHSALVTKKQMTIKEFEKEQARLLKDHEIADAYVGYQTRFPHQSAYFRASPSYRHQSATANGRKTGSDINLYKLFTERCHAILRENGSCGLVIPSGIYTDLGAKGLREMLFGEARITGLFGFENRREIFENVDSRFKFVVLTFERGGTTASFPTAFMRLDTAEIRSFPGQGAMAYPLTLVKSLSPDSLSLVELKSEKDKEILQKAMRFPALGREQSGSWKPTFREEVHMTNDSEFFMPDSGRSRVPLFEGKMMYQFRDRYKAPRFFIDYVAAGVARENVERYRVVFRKLASNTNERTLIATVLPPSSPCSNSLIVDYALDPSESLILAAMLNTFVSDYQIRMRMTVNLNMSFVYQLFIPRLVPTDAAGSALKILAARLTCTSPVFDGLAKKVGLASWSDGVTDLRERLLLRAEIDAIVAHLYGLSSEEYDYILATFPLVAEGEKEVMRAMFAVVAIKAETREQLAELDLQRMERAVREDRRVQQALDSAIVGEVRKRASKRPVKNELKKAA